MSIPLIGICLGALFAVLIWRIRNWSTNRFHKTHGSSRPLYSQQNRIGDDYDFVHEMALPSFETWAPKTTAEFPHIIENMKAVWQEPQARADYFNSLMTDNRGNRQGFPADVLLELFDLHELSVKGLKGKGGEDSWSTHEGRL